MKIHAEIIADSVNEYGNRITTFVLTYPRFIHAELLTHRLFSRNAASSRAIPASKMIKDIKEDPFIPVAWQKAHSGMQGTEYETDLATIEGIELEWLDAKDQAIKYATRLNNMEVTKQLVNRILELYQWYTCIVTATELDNFFELRCPQYEVFGGKYKSKKQALAHIDKIEYGLLGSDVNEVRNFTELDWLKRNKGQGEIHISLLAEAMWDARNESKPKQLKAGKWHIPFGDKMDEGKLGVTLEHLGEVRHESQVEDIHKVKIATARCARVSYMNFEGKDDYEADIKLYDRLLSMRHMSPFEHCARAMSEKEYIYNVQGKVEVGSIMSQDGDCVPLFYDEVDKSDPTQGWSGNFRGFVQLRKEIEN